MKAKRWILLIAAVMLLAGLVSCTAPRPAETATPIVTLPPVVTPTAEPTPMPTMEETPEASPMESPAESPLPEET